MDKGEVVQHVHLVLYGQLFDADRNVGKHAKQQPEAAVQQEFAACLVFARFVFGCLSTPRTVSELYCQASDGKRQLELPRHCCTGNFCCVAGMTEGDFADPYVRDWSLKSHSTALVRIRQRLLTSTGSCNMCPWTYLSNLQMDALQDQRTHRADGQLVVLVTRGRRQEKTSTAALATNGQAE